MAIPFCGRLVYEVFEVPLPPEVACESRLRRAGHILALETHLSLERCYWLLADFCHGRSIPEYDRVIRDALLRARLDPSSGEPFTQTSSSPEWQSAHSWDLPWDWIAKRAYFLWEQRGRRWGNPESDWHDAEHDLALLYPALGTQMWSEAA